MAEKRMAEIEKQVRARWPVRKMLMVHRYGNLRVGEVSVAVVVSSVHRAEAFEACRYAIDTIKRTAPIWKKEKLAGGRESWTKGEPIEG
jgi:molybdopterin synthase catalytic subunit